jgi:small-conductance mechanosensitive channel
VFPETIPGFEPRMRFHSFGDSSVNFTAWLGAKDYVSGLALKHEFIKRLHSRYGREGICIPFPITTIDLPETTIAKLRQIIGRPHESHPANLRERANNGDS